MLRIQHFVEPFSEEGSNVGYTDDIYFTAHSAAVLRNVTFGDSAKGSIACKFHKKYCAVKCAAFLVLRERVPTSRNDALA